MENHARIVPALLGTVALLGPHALPADATPIARTFISNSGNDSNSCAADSPRLTLNGAYAKTSAGGEINILDAGDYGSLTIAKSITIRGQGNTLGVTGTITISAGSSDVVNLVGLDILSGMETDGVVINSAGIVSIADCQFHDGHAGIYIGPSTPIAVSVNASLFQNNLYGIYAFTNSVTAKVVIDSVAIFGNDGAGGVGITADSSAVAMTVNNSTVMNNATGLSAINGAKLFSYGNNRVNFNGDNGEPNETVLTPK